MDYLFTSFYPGMFLHRKVHDHVGTSCYSFLQHWVAHWCSECFTVQEFFIYAIVMQGYINAYLKLQKEVISM